MRQHRECSFVPSECLNSTSVCRYKEKASFQFKWLSIDRQDGFGIFCIIMGVFQFYQLVENWFEFKYYIKKCTFVNNIFSTETAECCQHEIRQILL